MQGSHAVGARHACSGGKSRMKVTHAADESHARSGCKARMQRMQVTHAVDARRDARWVRARGGHAASGAGCWRWGGLAPAVLTGEKGRQAMLVQEESHVACVQCLRPPASGWGSEGGSLGPNAHECSQGRRLYWHIRARVKGRPATTLLILQYLHDQIVYYIKILIDEPKNIRIP